MAREIPLTRGAVAVVDDCDYERVAVYRWQALPYGRSFRARAQTPRSNGGRAIYLHRLILDAPQGVVVDHINGDSLDNRRCNLRLCTVQQNSYNIGPHGDGQAGYKGVTRSHGRWTARITALRVNHNLGVFQTAEEAARAYDAAALLHHGEFARLNFPPPHQEAA